MCIIKKKEIFFFEKLIVCVLLLHSPRKKESSNRGPFAKNIDGTLKEFIGLDIKLTYHEVEGSMFSASFPRKIWTGRRGESIQSTKITQNRMRNLPFKTLEEPFKTNGPQYSSKKNKDKWSQFISLLETWTKTLFIIIFYLFFPYPIK